MFYKPRLPHSSGRDKGYVDTIGDMFQQLLNLVFAVAEILLTYVPVKDKWISQHTLTLVCFSYYYFIIIVL